MERQTVKGFLTPRTPFRMTGCGVAATMKAAASRRTAKSAGGGGWGAGDGAIAAFAFLVIEEGFEEAGAIEIGPQGFRDQDFGVGNLPEKEIADAHFAAGANEEIGIR